MHVPAAQFVRRELPRRAVPLAMIGTAPRSAAPPRKNAVSTLKAVVTKPNTIGLTIDATRWTP